MDKIIQHAYDTHKKGNIDEAENLYVKILKDQPLNPDVNHNLGLIKFSKNKYSEALLLFKTAIQLNSKREDFWLSYGSVLFVKNLFEEAEASFNKVLELKKEHPIAYFNLGKLAQTLNKLDEAEKNYKKALEFKNDYSQAKFNLENIIKSKLLLSQIENFDYPSNKNKKNFIKSFFNKFLTPKSKLIQNPFISNLQVEPELIKNLYNVKSIELNKVKNNDTEIFNQTDARYGNGNCSDFKLFENNIPILKRVEKDLTKIMIKAVKSKIFIMDSFVNIYNSGSGSKPHNHIKEFDKINGLIDKKFSLTYYPLIGDQNCKEPGILKMYDPYVEILPSVGTIVIIPAFRKHSATYDGKKDRVMIGVNFYSLI